MICLNYLKTSPYNRFIIYFTYILFVGYYIGLILKYILHWSKNVLIWCLFPLNSSDRLILSLLFFSFILNIWFLISTVFNLFFIFNNILLISVNIFMIEEIIYYIYWAIINHISEINPVLNILSYININIQCIMDDSYYICYLGLQ